MTYILWNEPPVGSKWIFLFHYRWHNSQKELTYSYIYINIMLYIWHPKFNVHSSWCLFKSNEEACVHGGWLHVIPTNAACVLVSFRLHAVARARMSLIPRAAVIEQNLGIRQFYVQTWRSLNSVHGVNTQEANCNKHAAKQHTVKTTSPYRHNGGQKSS